MADQAALIVMGGPMGVYEHAKYPFLRDEMRLIESALKLGKPVLGVCLGSQLLASVLGAEVKKGERKELGWYTVTLTESPPRMRFLRESGLSSGHFTGMAMCFRFPAGSRLGFFAADSVPSIPLRQKRVRNVVSSRSDAGADLANALGLCGGFHEAGGEPPRLRNKFPNIYRFYRKLPAMYWVAGRRWYEEAGS